MRNAFAEEVTALARDDARLALLSGDIGNKLFDGFKAHAPQRFFNCGVAEANMIGVAAGLALLGLRPVVYTIAPFTTTRCLEQIRIDVCYHAAPVLIVGTGAGLSYAELGPTHHSLEDLAILRTLPGLRVLAPADAAELRALLRQCLAQQGPAYMRIGKKGEPAITDAVDAEPTLDRARVVRRGQRVAVLSTGTVMAEALDAARRLKAQGIDAEVVSLHTVKPLDTAYLDEAARRFELLVTLEEHGVIGGLGSAVAEWRSARHAPCRHLALGTPDAFLHAVGSQGWARAEWGLTGEAVAARVMALLQP